MRDEILLLLLAGHHTTGNAAAWVLYFWRPGTWTFHQACYRSAPAMGNSGEVDPLKLPKAEISLRVAREALRLYPPF